MKVDYLTVTEFETNCYFVYDQLFNTIIIDPGGESGKIINFIQQRNLKPVSIINTHGHSDHICADRELSEKYNIPVLFHEQEKDMMFDNNLNLSNFTGFDYQPPVNYKVLKDRDIISAGSENLKIKLTPGHTSGSITLFNAKFALVGDLIFKDGVGRTDLPTGDFKVLENSIRNFIYTLPGETILYPGHGPTTTVDYERENNPFVQINRSL